MTFESEREIMRGYLSSKRWVLQECGKCQTPIYVKPGNSNCNSSSCQPNFPFLGLPNKKYKPIEDFYQELNAFFSEDYARIPARKLVNTIGNTLFISAGVQCMEGNLFGISPPPKTPGYVAQPSFRAQFLDLIDSGTRDLCRSFVNVTTVQINPTFEEHLKHVDRWVSFLSKEGIYAGNLALAPKTKESNWGTGKFNKFVVDFNFLGLQLGTASYCSGIPTKDGRVLTISDIGFGLERMLWGVNKTPEISGCLETGLGSALLNKEQYDLIRAITLLAMSGVQPSNKAQGYRLRQLSKLYSQKGFSLDPHPDRVKQAYSFFERFTTPEMSCEETTGAIYRELENAFNVLLLEKLNIQLEEKVAKMRTSDLLSWFSAQGFTMNQIREAIAKIKNV